ncbi:hypothetical protein [Streptomyces sp. NPDC059786]|uniref:hypothetical protein n=1 Tax=Streptomyces sp. NPDC059786 TaxID=3346946 RepID=UPI00365B43FB
MTIASAALRTYTVTSAGGRQVEVTCDEGTATALVALLEPFGTMQPADDRGTPRPRPRVLDLSTPPAGADWQRLAYGSRYEPDRVLWVQPAERTVALCGGPSEWRTQQLLRCVRNLLRWEHFADGELFLHGGMVDIDGRGIAFVGRKRSGKTSSIISALLHGGADFVSNDDLVVTGSGGRGELRGLGFPRSINVRTDSLLALAAERPELYGLLKEAGHPANAFPGTHHTTEPQISYGSGMTAPSRTWVRCRELADATGRRLVASGRLHAVVFPAFLDTAARPDVRRLSHEEAGRLLAENTEEAALKYDPFLAPWYPATQAHRRAVITKELLRSVPCYRLTQHMRHLPAATSALVAAVLD